MATRHIQVATETHLTVPAVPHIAVRLPLVRSSHAVKRTSTVRQLDFQVSSFWGHGWCHFLFQRINNISIATQILAEQLCGPLYVNNSSLSSSVAAAIATATSVAVSAVSGKNVTDPASYPQCAVRFSPSHLQLRPLPLGL